RVAAIFAAIYALSALPALASEALASTSGSEVVNIAISALAILVAAPFAAIARPLRGERWLQCPQTTITARIRWHPWAGAGSKHVRRPRTNGRRTDAGRDSGHDAAAPRQGARH